MSNAQIKKILDKALKEAEGEALEDGIDITNPEFEAILRQLKAKILQNLGTTIEVFEEYERKSVTKRKEELRGFKGDKGEGTKGDTGLQGQEGKQGKSIVGPKGLQGKQGPQGKTGKTFIALRGKQGSEGPQGPKGDSINKKELLKWIEEQTKSQIGSPLFEDRVLEMTVKQQERIIEPLRRLGMGLQGQIDSLSTQITAENLWDRTGTTLEPHTAGDNVLTTGTVLGSNIISGSGIKNITVGTEEPTSPVTGDFWLDQS